MYTSKGGQWSPTDQVPWRCQSLVKLNETWVDTIWSAYIHRGEAGNAKTTPRKHAPRAPHHICMKSASSSTMRPIKTNVFLFCAALHLLAHAKRG
ncbi:hypothetical protein PoB_006163800 [Plakobranchus ocellatus]|uniref:Uncharacterized protein n=1 Tax=Plakobranchus ocellatus TaxID=259542 RepID=A0AAV4CTD7_9GAST|nr:hypothetical protein PoB_006163800 [Plakobranchus ocellatus]